MRELMHSWTGGHDTQDARGAMAIDSLSLLRRTACTQAPTLQG
jgi:hypothetical protein